MTIVNQQYRALNPAGDNPRAISEVVNNLLNGKSNNTGDFTTTQSATTTNLYNERIGTSSVILFTPMNDKAASEMASLYVHSLNKDTNLHS
jgi:excinuclease UvrABC helicase subunit UvrB